MKLHTLISIRITEHLFNCFCLQCPILNRVWPGSQIVPRPQVFWEQHTFWETVLCIDKIGHVLSLNISFCCYDITFFLILWALSLCCFLSPICSSAHISAPRLPSTCSSPCFLSPGVVLQCGQMVPNLVLLVPTSRQELQSSMKWFGTEMRFSPGPGWNWEAGDVGLDVMPITSLYPWSFLLPMRSQGFPQP